MSRLPTVRAQGLLVFLAVESALGAAEQGREALIELFWPGMPPGSGRKSLRTTLYYLRRALGEEFLLADRHIVRIDPDFPLWLDVAEFVGLLNGPEAGWPAAVELYRSDFLSDFAIADTNPFEEWAGVRRATLRRQLLQSLEGLADSAMSRGHLAEVERLARRQLELDVLRESAWRQLIESLARRGRPAEALAEYEACVEMLWQELGAEPSAETLRLRQDILEGKLVSPESESGPLPSGQARPRHNLPAQMTPFIGRERAMAELEALLKTARLVTLTGPGGSGKTRLCLQVAERVAGAYPGGLNFVALASTTDPALVASAVACELGVIEQPARPLVDSLGRYLGTKRTVLVLDSFEHVLEAAPMVTELLAAAPNLTIMTTSREALGLQGEYEYLVEPLAVPDLTVGRSIGDLATCESVDLFVQRSQAVLPGFRLTTDNAVAVATICTHLDGLPLAIELAAARIRLFSPQQMLERLESRLSLLRGSSRDQPSRQRTLRDTIRWSYDLLDEQEQRLFSRLAVFTGGCTIESAEAICAPSLSIDALDGLEALLRKSLLYQKDDPGGARRLMMLETLREYAAERLADSGEEQHIRDRHLAYFLAWAEDMEPGYRQHGQMLLLDRTEAEMDNLRLAFNWALACDDLPAAARLVAAIDYFLFYRDRMVEGYQWVNRLRGGLATVPGRYRIQCLLTASRLAWLNGDLEQCRSFCEEALALAREMGDRPREAWALVYLSLPSMSPSSTADEQESSIRRCEEGLALLRQMEDRPGMAQALTLLGIMSAAAGNYDQAQHYSEEGFEVSLETGEIIRQGLTLANLAFVAYQKGEYGRAQALNREYLRQMFKAGMKQQTSTGLAAIAGPLGRLGETEKAARLLGASAALMAELGIDHHPSDHSAVAKYVADVRGQMDEAAFEAAWVGGQAMTLEQAVAYALGD